MVPPPPPSPPDAMLGLGILVCPHLIMGPGIPVFPSLISFPLGSSFLLETSLLPYPRPGSAPLTGINLVTGTAQYIIGGTVQAFYFNILNF